MDNVYLIAYQPALHIKNDTGKIRPLVREMRQHFADGVVAVNLKVQRKPAGFPPCTDHAGEGGIYLYLNCGHIPPRFESAYGGR